MPKRSILIILLILLFASTIFIFNVTSIPILSNLAQQIAATPKTLLYKMRIGSGDDKEKKLEIENEKLRQKIVDHERLKRDNLALRDQFETQETLEYRLLPARIIGSQGSFSRPAALIIDQGSKSGIQKGMAAVFKNNLLGKIDAVSDNFSKIILSHNERFVTLARTSGTNVLGVARGTGDFILIDQISINDTIVKDQMVLTRGEISEKGFGIPPDFIIGKISSVNKNESLPNQSAKVESIMDISRIDMVFIVMSL